MNRAGPCELRSAAPRCAPAALRSAGLPVRRLTALACVVLFLAAGCAGSGIFSRGPLRLSQIGSEGDPARRASLRLCLQGLDSDSGGRPRLARSRYERAIQIDATNPFAYLALARHEVERGDPQRALEYLDRAEMLLDSEGVRSPRVEPHLVGLRGAALEQAGLGGEELLARAYDLSPSVWDDGWLTAAELR